MSGSRLRASASLWSSCTRRRPQSREPGKQLMSFQDRTVWITGASSGIGEALAEAFHDAGAKLILSARREAELQRVQAKCGGEPNTRILPLDMSQAEEIPNKARAALDMFAGIDFLVLNAVSSKRSRARDTDDAVYRRLMEVDFFGPEALTRAVLPRMLENKRGHIVVISSIAGKFGVPLRSGYSAAKFALHGFYEALRAEEARNGIRVTLVCPGFIRTGIRPSDLKAGRTRHAKMDPELAQGMPAEQCARHILKAVARQKEEICVGAVKEKALLYLKR